MNARFFPCHLWWLIMDSWFPVGWGSIWHFCSLVAAAINFQDNLLKAVSVFSYRCLPLASCWIFQAWYRLCFASVIKLYPFELVFQLHCYLKDSHKQLEDSGEVLHLHLFFFWFSPFIHVSCSFFYNINCVSKYDQRVQSSNSILGAKFSQFSWCNKLPSFEGDFLLFVIGIS